MKHTFIHETVWRDVECTEAGISTWISKEIFKYSYHFKYYTSDFRRYNNYFNIF